VARRDPLLYGIVPRRVEDDAIVSYMTGLDPLVAIPAGHVGYEGLDHEYTSPRTRRPTLEKHRTWSSCESRAKKVLKTTYTRENTP
jgi:hypothetical protein